MSLAKSIKFVLVPFDEDKPEENKPEAINEKRKLENESDSIEAKEKKVKKRKNNHEWIKPIY